MLISELPQVNAMGDLAVNVLPLGPDGVPTAGPGTGWVPKETTASALRDLATAADCFFSLT